MQVCEEILVLSPTGTAWAMAESGPGQGAVLRLSGRLDLAATRQLGPELFELARSGRTLDVDLSGIVAIEPAGLALLISCLRLAHASGGRPCVVAASPAASQALRRSGLHGVLPPQGRPQVRPAAPLRPGAVVGRVNASTPTARP
jgi:anti-anti-sigma factor